MIRVKDIHGTLVYLEKLALKESTLQSTLTFENNILIINYKKLMVLTYYGNIKINWKCSLPSVDVEPVLVCLLSSIFSFKFYFVSCLGYIGD